MATATTRINSIVGLEYNCRLSKSTSLFSRGPRLSARSEFLISNGTDKNSYSSSSHHSISGIGSDNYSLTDSENSDENSNEKKTNPKEKKTNPKEKKTNPKEKKTNPKEKKTNPKEKKNETTTTVCLDFAANNPQDNIGNNIDKRTYADGDGPSGPDRPDPESGDQDNTQDVDHDRKDPTLPNFPDPESGDQGGDNGSNDDSGTGSDGSSDDSSDGSEDDLYDDQDDEDAVYKKYLLHYYFNSDIDSDSDGNNSDSDENGENSTGFGGTECSDTANPSDPDSSDNEENRSGTCDTHLEHPQEDRSGTCDTPWEHPQEDRSGTCDTHWEHPQEDRPEGYFTDCLEFQDTSEICIDSDNAKNYSHLWVQCENCYTLNYKRFLKEKMNICEECGYHLKMTSSDRIELLIDPGTWDAMDEGMVSLDPIEFHSEDDPYLYRIQSYQQETGLSEAVQTGTGQLNGIPLAMGVMDFRFIGGSMGSVVGEKITRLIEYAAKNFLPLILVCASGGARMQEGSLSLMQMAKISSALYDYQLNKKLFFVSILTSPTTGGVTASFGMLGDIIIAEPNSYIAFAGKRVIEETLKKTVPEGSQETEFLFDKGLFDLIVPRNLLKDVLTELFYLHDYSIRADGTA